MVTHQRFISHYLKAAAWVRYNSASGRATERRILRTMHRFSDDTLAAMLRERNVQWFPSYDQRQQLRDRTLAVGR